MGTSLCWETEKSPGSSVAPWSLSWVHMYFSLYLLYSHLALLLGILARYQIDDSLSLTSLVYILGNRKKIIKSDSGVIQCVQTKCSFGLGLGRPVVSLIFYSGPLREFWGLHQQEVG
jgi:hypothetical protein